MLAATAVSLPLCTLSFSSILLYSLTISAPALYKSRVSSVAQCVKGGKVAGKPFRQKAVEGESLTLLIDAEYIIKPVTYVTWHCVGKESKSQLQFMDFPALMNHNVTWNEFNEAAKAALNIHKWYATIKFYK